MCDKCWTSYKNDFTYYSANMFIDQIVDNRVPKLGKGEPTFSFDLCEQCDQDIRRSVVTNYHPTRRSPDGSFHNGLYCELTGKHLKGNYTLGYCVVDKVVVKLSESALACSKCGTPTTNQDSVCKCGNATFHRKADIRVDKRNYEFIICEEEYQQWRNRSLQLRQNPETNQWSTNQS